MLKTISFENADEINYQNVFFIDNETMQKQQSILEDFDYFITMSLYQEFYKIPNLDISQLHTSFIQGYIESFPTNKQVKNLFLDKISSLRKSFCIILWLFFTSSISNPTLSCLIISKKIK